MRARRLSIVIIAGIVLGCACATTSAPPTGTIAGVVVDDSTGALLHYANVLIVKSERDLFLEDAGRREFEGAQEVKASSAHFALGNAAPGFYLVRGWYVAYLQGTQRVEVIANDTTHVTVRLRRDPRIWGPAKPPELIR